MTWHDRSATEVLEALDSSAQGLDPAEARRRLDTHGPNVLTEQRRRTALGIALAQFRDFMILVLLAAAVISGWVGDLEDTLVISAILILNAVIGFVQEHRAERAVAALRRLAAPSATVIRSGRQERIPASQVVPGDVVLVEAGAIVPADLRLIEVAALRVDEAALTGESVPVEKTSEALPDPTLPVADRRNLAYKGTTITYGRGRGVAVATGMATEVGRIATMLQQAGDVTTPLQRRLGAFGRRLAVVVLAICAIVFVAGMVRGESPFLMFMTALSLAVAAIPEALPAVVAITLALGARKMVAARALVRRLPAVETLGSVTYVCSDKTGTLTLNRMRVEAFYCDGVVAGRPSTAQPWEALLQAMALSNDAAASVEGPIVGDPTEVALLAAAREAGVEKTPLESRYPRVAEIPFDSDRKCMTTVHRHPDGGFVSFTKGAVEIVHARSAHLALATGPVALESAEVLQVSERMADEGLRVLALAARRWAVLPEEPVAAIVERELTLLGLVGLLDPPREEVRDAVHTCYQAGIVPVMITGDHPLTARAIARRLDFADGDDAILTGRDLASLSDEELAHAARRTRVYARVAPEQKLRIVQALQARGEIVAMTGDGVNDAPALRQADIGIAMGVTGTDVSKEASAMILLDDNFATIVRAVREGRKIYDNIRRFVRYALTTNSAEVWTIFLAPFLGLPIPLLPIHILWINLVTDGLPGLALAAEPAERDVMRRPPRPPREGVFAHGLGVHVVWVGVLMAAVALGTEAWFLTPTSTRWQTMVFTVLALSQLAHVLAIRSERDSLLTQGLLSNRPLAGVVTLTVALQLAAIYAPPLNELLRTEPLALSELAVALGVSSLVLVAVEAEKWVKRIRGSPHGPLPPVDADDPRGIQDHR